MTHNASTTPLTLGTIVRAVAASALRQVLALRRALRHRREVMELASFDDRLLKDIGVTRTDVIGALSEPYHVDPSTMLRLRSVERRALARSAALSAKADPERPRCCA
ncbi:MAG TPA: DUF1127 domain-containing protein [Beijerinckiaceae bacterium]|nr:DUF1127 domain-containing protein [Beijerinckiaceae bacterium]